MLAPDDRSVLLDLLRPPVGFELDRAVGTSFSIDLETALVVPLAFASFRLSGTADPIAVMEAVRSAADRVDIFSQAGQMHVPAKPNGLFAFLEGVVHDARAARPGRLFHPKVWFLRYLDPDGEIALRLLCLTRNLTKDASWDVAVRLDGELGRTRSPANRQLRDFIRALPDLAVRSLGPVRREAIDSLAEHAWRAEWERPPDVNTDPQIWSFGVPTTRDRPDFGGYRHLVVAPFVNDEGLELVTDPRSVVTLVSRVEDLDRLGDVGRGVDSTFVISSAADLDDPDANVLAPEHDRLHGLHAKLYVVERNRGASVFIGSANATDAAFTGNVEVLVELRGGATKLGVDRFLDPVSGFGQLLESYQPAEGTPDDPLEDLRWQAVNALRAIAAIPLSATVIPAAEGKFLQQVRADDLPLPDGITATIALITAPGQAVAIAPGTLDVLLGPVDLDEVTPFLVLRVTATDETGNEAVRSSIVRAELIDDPAERLDEILARQVDTPEKFLRFLLLLLGLSDGTLLLGDGEGAGEHGEWLASRGSNAVFELLTRAATDRPEIVADLHRLVTRLRATERGRCALPEGFDEIWTVIEAADQHLRAVRDLMEAER